MRAPQGHTDSVDLSTNTMTQPTRATIFYRSGHFPVFYVRITFTRRRPTHSPCPCTQQPRAHGKRPTDASMSLSAKLRSMSAWSGGSAYSSSANAADSAPAFNHEFRCAHCASNSGFGRPQSFRRPSALIPLLLRSLSHRHTNVRLMPTPVPARSLRHRRPPPGPYLACTAPIRSAVAPRRSSLK